MTDLDALRKRVRGLVADAPPLTAHGIEQATRAIMEAIEEYIEPIIAANRVDALVDAARVRLDLAP